MIQSERNYWREYFVYPMMFILFSFLAYAIFVNEHPGKYYDLRLLSFDTLFIAMALIGLVHMVKFDSITIVNGELNVYSILGTKKFEIELSNITSWIEVERKGKGGEMTKYFTIYFDGRKYKFKSSYYENYDELVETLKPYGVRDINLENKQKKKYTGKGGGILVSLGIVLLITSIVLYLSNTKIISSGEVAAVAGVVDNKPKIEVSSKGSKSMVILLRNYPDFAFHISGSTYKAMQAQKYVNEVQYGDSIFINIDKGVYERKITGNEPLSFWDKHWDYRDVEPLEIYSRYSSYLSLNDYNKENNNDIVGFVICAALGGFWILIGAAISSKREKSPTI